MSSPPADAERPLLAVRDLHVRFETSEGVVYALNGVDLELRRGEVLGIVGESGSGKSVSALAVMGLIPYPGRVVAGTVEYDGRDLLALPKRDLRRIRGNEIAMVFQDPMASLNPVLRIGRQVTEALRRNQGMDAPSARARGIELLQMVGVPEAEARLNDFPYQFSGGMLQRVMIAMALSCEPSLLIADEPTTALDVTIQAQILRLLADLGRQLGMSLILISHDLGVVAGLADRLCVMYAGRVVEIGNARDLFEHPQHPYLIGLLRSTPRLDSPRDEPLEPIPGAPPDMSFLPQHCSFAPRCRFAIEESWEKVPELRSVGPEHRVACCVSIDADGNQRTAT